MRFHRQRIRRLKLNLSDLDHPLMFVTFMFLTLVPLLVLAWMGAQKFGFV